MNVQELIEELQKVEDKTLTVCIAGEYECYDPQEINNIGQRHGDYTACYFSDEGIGDYIYLG